MSSSSDSNDVHGMRTKAIHAGEQPDPTTGASSPNIVMSSTFVIDEDISFSAEDMSDSMPFVYTRWANPTITQLEEKLAALEECEGCVAFASGVAAITAVFLATLHEGDHLVMSDVTYAAASEFANDTLPCLGIEVTRVDTSKVSNIAAALRPNTKLVYLENPCNPLIRLTDVEAVVNVAHTRGVKVAVDSTFATPVSLRPAALGADYVLHSLTKYICGHGDALGGAVLGKIVDLGAIKSISIHTGGVISPFNAWLILRGAATLPIRMKAHEENALALASYLEGHPKITRVIYPGLPSHPQHELASRMFSNHSGMLTFQVERGSEAARIFARNLSVIHYAVSLGHQRSLICYLDTGELLRTSFHLTPDQEASFRTYAGEGMFRLSVGLEDPIDLIADLENVLELLG